LPYWSLVIFELLRLANGRPTSNQSWWQCQFSVVSGPRNQPQKQPALVTGFLLPRRRAKWPRGIEKAGAGASFRYWLFSAV